MITRERVMWFRWDQRRLRNVATERWQWVYTDADDYRWACDTKREALEREAQDQESRS